MRGACAGGVTIGKDLMIAGASAGATLDGGGRKRVLEIRSGSTVRLAHLIIRRGAARYGGGVLNTGMLTLAHAVVRDNRAGPRDGCETADPTCQWRRGEANRGGGIANEGGLTLLASHVRGNTAGRAGGIDNALGATLTIIDSTIADNRAGQFGESQGGGIDNAGTLDVSRSTVARNTIISGEGYSAGGGIFNTGDLTVTDTTISGNHVVANNGGFGGGIANGTEYGPGPGDVVLTGRP